MVIRAEEGAQAVALDGDVSPHAPGGGLRDRRPQREDVCAALEPDPGALQTLPQRHSFSDLWTAYAAVFDERLHTSVGKGAGQTNHMERWYCTLRQRLWRYVRRTLSFSKSEAMHHMVTKWFIVEHNRKAALKT